MVLEEVKPYGVKWERINFEDDKITIAHTVTVTSIGHKSVIEKKDILKNNSSYRTFPLKPVIKNFLEQSYEQQKRNKELFGNAYLNNENYVSVNMDGSLISPNV